MNEQLLKQKKDLEKERQICLQRSYNLSQRANRITEQLSEIEKQIEIRVLAVTDHAYERFKERVMEIPDKRIKPILTDKKLLEDYKKHGNGNYALYDMPHIEIVIQDFAVVTVINRMNYLERAELLRAYINYFVDARVEQEISGSSKPLRLKTFRKYYYKSRVKNAA